MRHGLVIAILGLFPLTPGGVRAQECMGTPNTGMLGSAALMAGVGEGGWSDVGVEAGIRPRSAWSLRGRVGRTRLPRAVNVAAEVDVAYQLGPSDEGAVRICPTVGWHGDRTSHEDSGQTDISRWSIPVGVGVALSPRDWLGARVHPFLAPRFFLKEEFFTGEPTRNPDVIGPDIYDPGRTDVGVDIGVGLRRGALFAAVVARATWDTGPILLLKVGAGL